MTEPSSSAELIELAREARRAKAFREAFLECSKGRHRQAVVVEKVRAWASTAAYGEGDYYSGYDSAQAEVLEILESLKEEDE